MLVRVAALCFLFGCSVTDVGSPSGVFPCATADECPDGQSCVVGKCYSGDAPTLDVVTPEDEQAVDWTPGGDDVEVAVKIGGSNLELVDPASDADSQFGSGQVVFVSSDAAVAAYPRWGAYSASKAAADHLARVWAAELAGSGVRVVAIDPGEMDTAMHSAAIPDADRSVLQRPADVARLLADVIGDAQIENGARLSLTGRPA